MLWKNNFYKFTCTTFDLSVEVLINNVVSILQKVGKLTLAQPRGLQCQYASATPYVLWRYFAVRRTGFQILGIHPEILSARGQVKMSAIVHHGAT